MAGTKINNKLVPRQELFCQYYVSQELFANGTQSYIRAYDVDVTKKGAYAAARSSASKLLTNGNILARIRELLDMSGLNDEFVDKELLFLITQNAELSSKVAAIREYNKLKKRISDQVDITTNGKELPSTTYPTELAEILKTHYKKKEE